MPSPEKRIPSSRQSRQIGPRAEPAAGSRPFSRSSFPRAFLHDVCLDYDACDGQDSENRDSRSKSFVERPRDEHRSYQGRRDDEGPVEEHGKEHGAQGSDDCAYDQDDPARRQMKERQERKGEIPSGEETRKTDDETLEKHSQDSPQRSGAERGGYHDPAGLAVKELGHDQEGIEKSQQAHKQPV